MIKKAALFASIIAILYILWLFVIISIDLSKIQTGFNIPLVFNSLLIGIPLYIGLLSIRKHAYSNEINFAQAFYAGITISVFAALLVLILLALCEVAGILIPDLIEDAINLRIPELIKEKKSQAEIDQFIANVKEPYVYALGNGIQVLMISAFSSTILSLFVRNKDTFNENK
ncbi:DUF4199 domain-containing protein [Cytophaga hutchinsonii]|uniref:DUF4199 domain-containing protein n=1 Tax=Cytophaga hutchinsonii (strain ATCC 33406 / DSM 1761 / CIP 103989 / NBRC 15051 / NCIMB 9469 / D465) TaxID=269798 RepID=A0A6N4SU99_CYTH3|nr:DUF4199 domain-containing protein [Cytophaga hutchinsonii]ABG59893.1 hypothetical protein CHU_2641 [Cytophaga hutchinsonii ATCC 33406]SFX27911.1 Protein of unknown function [Cytophaga hutchinsonii ATCC 33406]